MEVHSHMVRYTMQAKWFSIYKLDYIIMIIDSFIQVSWPVAMLGDLCNSKSVYFNRQTHRPNKWPKRGRENSNFHKVNTICSSLPIEPITCLPACLPAVHHKVRSSQLGYIKLHPQSDGALEWLFLIQLSCSISRPSSASHPARSRVAVVN